MKKEHSEYHKEYYGSKKKGKKIIFLGLLVIIAISSFSIFSGNIKFTGNVISSLNSSNSVRINAVLSGTQINLKGDYEEIIIHLNKGGEIILGDKKISLDSIENKIILNGFSGEIGFDENKITLLNGRTSGVSINNLPLSSQGDTKMKISLSNQPTYNFLNIERGVYFRQLSLITSGNINFEGDSLSLNSENLVMRNYLGGISVREEKFIFDGFVENLKIESDFRKLNLFK